MIRTWNSDVDGDGPYTQDQQVLDLRDVLPEEGVFLVTVTLRRRAPGTGMVQLTPFWLPQDDPYLTQGGGPNLDLTWPQTTSTLLFPITKRAKDASPDAQSEFGFYMSRSDGADGSWAIELLIIGAGP